MLGVAGCCRYIAVIREAFLAKALSPKQVEKSSEASSAPRGRVEGGVGHGESSKAHA